jgi:hypothetical protein
MHSHTHAHSSIAEEGGREGRREKRERNMSVRGCVRERERESERKAQTNSGDLGGTIDIASMNRMESHALPLHALLIQAIIVSPADRQQPLCPEDGAPPVRRAPLIRQVYPAPMPSSDWEVPNCNIVLLRVRRAIMSCCASPVAAQTNSWRSPLGGATDHRYGVMDSLFL